jgi:hypothetical protein
VRVFLTYLVLSKPVLLGFSFSFSSSPHSLFLLGVFFESSRGANASVCPLARSPGIIREKIASFARCIYVACYGSALAPCVVATLIWTTKDDPPEPPGSPTPLQMGLASASATGLYEYTARTRTK